MNFLGKGETMKRKTEREIIVLALYSMELSGNEVEDTVNFIMKQKRIKEEPTEYIYESIRGVLENLLQIDEVISQNLENYKINRLNCVDLAIIRFATYELMYRNELHPAIIINEAVELTKKYSELDDFKASAFNNKLLDKIRVSLESRR